MPFRTIKKLGKDTEEMPEEEINVSEIVSSLIKKRRSVRKYKEKGVDMDLILKVLDSAKHAPSCGNYQPWEFIVVRNPELREHLVEAAYNQRWMLQAPVFIVACINNRLAGAVYGQRGLRLYGIQAVAAAIQNILLTAEYLGLGTCWVGAFSENNVSVLLHCPDYIRPCAIITLGYPDENPEMPVRQDLEEFTHIEVFGNTLQMERVKTEKKPTYMKFK